MNVFPAAEDSTSTVERVRAAAAAQPGEVLVGGAVPGNVDFNDAVYGNFIWVVLLILAITYVLLARVFRSLLLPLKAVIFSVISIGAVWGFLVWFWQKGHGSGSIFNVEPTGALVVWIPVMVFAFLYGLSMDYEVFILSRMREEYDRDGSTDRAVVAGLARTGRLVTAGSLILFLAFVALGSGPEVDVKVFATGLAVGIILDATVSAACSCRRSSACWGAGTGGCRCGPPASCGSSRVSPRPSAEARCPSTWSLRPAPP